MEKELLRTGYSGAEKNHTRWCETMSGREFGRINSWGSGPGRGVRNALTDVFEDGLLMASQFLQGDFQLASPSSHLELPQTLLEPILLRYATQHGFPCRFRTQFLSFNDSAGDVIVVTVRDMIFDTTEIIRTKYLFGADGAKSRIVQQLGLPMSVKPSQGIALNVLLRADLSNLTRTRVGNLHYVVRPDAESPDFAWWSIVRMVKPWYEWLVIMMYKPTCSAEFTPSVDQVQAQVHAVIGDESILVEIQRIDKWIINETVAETYSRGNM